MKNLTTGTTASTRGRLNRSNIVEAALAIVRAEGLGAVTMRRVATDLGAGAMSLYRHVTDRDDLLVGMMDQVAVGIEPPTEQMDDREEIVAILMTLHHAFRQDPWIVHVLLFEGRGSLKIFPLIDRLFAALLRLGCTQEQALDHYGLLMHYAYGESLSFQTKDQRRMMQSAWSDDALAEFPAIMAVREEAQAWAYDEFGRNIRRLVANI